MMTPDPSLTEQVFCIFDTETASMDRDVQKMRVCEVGVIRTRNEKELERFQSLVNPQVPIAPDVERVHRISTDMVRDAPIFAEVAPRLMGVLRGAILVAHNVSFDSGVLNAEMERAQLAPWSGQAIDTVVLARRSFSGIPSYGLDGLIRFFELQVPSRHRAMGDCEATFAVFWRCVRRLQELGRVKTLADLIQAGRRRVAPGPSAGSGPREGGLFPPHRSEGGSSSSSPIGNPQAKAPDSEEPAR